MKTNISRIVERVGEENLLVADGFDGAIIGYDSKTLRIVYSVKKSIELLMKESKMSQEEATEYFYFNVEGAYVGEQTPIWVEDEF